MRIGYNDNCTNLNQKSDNMLNSFGPITSSILEQFVAELKQEETMDMLQDELINPIVMRVASKCYPYLILFCIIFILMIGLLVSILISVSRNKNFARTT